MTIQEAIRKIAASGLELYCKVCKVEAVDEETRTIDCSPIDGSAPLLGVNLQANQKSEEGVVLFPAVGSYVVVAFMNPSVGMVVLQEKVDKVCLKIGETSSTWTGDRIEIAVKDTTVSINSEKIVMNGGQIGGMLNAEKFISKINELITIFNNHVHTINGSSVDKIASPFFTLNIGDFKDDRVTH